MGDLGPGPVTYFAEPALLRMAATILGEVVAHNIFHVAGIAVVGLHGYVLGQRP